MSPTLVVPTLTLHGMPGLDAIALVCLACLVHHPIVDRSVYSTRIVHLTRAVPEMCVLTPVLVCAGSMPIAVLGTIYPYVAVSKASVATLSLNALKSQVRKILFHFLYVSS